MQSIQKCFTQPTLRRILLWRVSTVALDPSVILGICGAGEAQYDIFGCVSNSSFMPDEELLTDFVCRFLSAKWCEELAATPVAGLLSRAHRGRLSGRAQMKLSIVSTNQWNGSDFGRLLASFPARLFRNKGSFLLRMWSFPGCTRRHFCLGPCGRCCSNAAVVRRMIREPGSTIVVEMTSWMSLLQQLWTDSCVSYSRKICHILPLAKTLCTRTSGHQT